MQPLGAGFGGALDFPAKPGGVGGEQRRCDNHARRIKDWGNVTSDEWQTARND
jgi:hypothetical protein